MRPVAAGLCLSCCTFKGPAFWSEPVGQGWLAGAPPLRIHLTPVRDVEGLLLLRVVRWLVLRPGLRFVVREGSVEQGSRTGHQEA